MSNGDSKQERLGSLIKETDFKLYKIEARTFKSNGTFDPKNIRGGYTVNEVTNINKTTLSADISLNISNEGENKFFEFDIMYNVTFFLLKELENQHIEKEDTDDLFTASLPHVDELINPITKSMGFTFKL